MKLGTIIGIVFSCLLIIGGIVLCSIGVSTAEENGQTLFTQKDENGTYHRLIIDENITRIDLNLENVDVIVSGNADVSEIEFYNFNPNNYALEVTPNVISFEETPKIKSISDILKNGFNFKGLRYALDPNNYTYENDDKRVVINLADTTDIKVLDITAEKGSVDVTKLDTDSDITVSLVRGIVKLNEAYTSSVIDINGTAIETVIEKTKALNLKYTAEKSEVSVNNSDFSTSQISVIDGNVNYNISSSVENTQINASSDTGSLSVNSKSSSSPFRHETEALDKTLEIKCKSANINITYPVAEVSDEEVSADTNE